MLIITYTKHNFLYNLISINWKLTAVAWNFDPEILTAVTAGNFDLKLISWNFDRSHGRLASILYWKSAIIFLNRTLIYAKLIIYYILCGSSDPGRLDGLGGGKFGGPKAPPARRKNFWNFPPQNSKNFPPARIIFPPPEIHQKCIQTGVFGYK